MGKQVIPILVFVSKVELAALRFSGPLFGESFDHRVFLKKPDKIELDQGCSQMN